MVKSPLSTQQHLSFFRSSTWSIISRRLLPASLLLAGAGCVIYGALFNVISATENREEKTTISVPMPFNPEATPGAQPFIPQQQTIQGTKTTAIIHHLSEPNIIFQASVGGVTLDESGKIELTYSGTKGPALCPT